MTAIWKSQYLWARPSRLPPSPIVMCIIPHGSLFIKYTRVCSHPPKTHIALSLSIPMNDNPQTVSNPSMQMQNLQTNSTRKQLQKVAIGGGQSQSWLVGMLHTMGGSEDNAYYYHAFICMHMASKYQVHSCLIKQWFHSCHHPVTIQLMGCIWVVPRSMEHCN
jgi:hypothetical protein